MGMSGTKVVSACEPECMWSAGAALVRLYAKATDPEARNIRSALAQAVPRMARLEGAGSLDIRELVTQAADQAVNSRRPGTKLADMAARSDVDTDPAIQVVLTLSAGSARSVKPILESLRRAAEFAYTEASKAGADMFGVVERAGRADALDQLEASREARSQKDVVDQAGREPAGQNADRQGPKPGRPGTAAQDEGGRRAAPGDQADLFGDPLSASARGNRQARPAGTGVRGNVQPKPGVLGDNAAPAVDYHVRTTVGVTAQRKLGASVIKTAADAATTTRYLYKSAVERMGGSRNCDGWMPKGLHWRTYWRLSVQHDVAAFFVAHHQHPKLCAYGIKRVRLFLRPAVADVGAADSAFDDVVQALVDHVAGHAEAGH